MHKKLVAGLLVGWISVVSSFALAADAPTVAADPALEKRVMAVSEELRCLVCQNQTIADSHAELAVDLRNQVREMLQKGMSEREIKDYMVNRYGDFVLYRPELKSNTWLLWIGPFVLLVAGLSLLIVKLRRRNRDVASAEQAMSAEAVERAEALLGIEHTESAADVRTNASNTKDKA